MLPRLMYGGFLLAGLSFCPATGYSAEGTSTVGHSQQNVLRFPGLSASTAKTSKNPVHIALADAELPRRPRASSINRHRNSYVRCLNRFWRTIAVRET